MSTPTEPVSPPVSPPAAPPVPTPGRARWREHLPLALLGLLLALYAAFVATQGAVHGRSWDEGAQDWYGEAVYQWYASRGADLTFMQAHPALQMPQHGPVVELVIAAAQHAFDGVDHWHVRSLAGGVIGLLGVVGIALCGREVAGRWGALLAAAGLALYPRYTGAIFNNSKDMPLAVAMIFLLWLTLRLARRWSVGNRYLFDSALVGAVLGIAVSIRVTSLLWTGVLGLMAAGWWWARWRRRAAGGRSWPREIGRQLVAAALIAGCAYLAMIATWPYVALHPVDGLVDSIRSMSRYPWNGTVLFAGEVIPAAELPRSYAPAWLLVGSPLPTVVFGLAGAAFLVVDAVRRRPVSTPALISAGLLVVPLAAIVVLRPTLYNGLRHFLFVVPGLILLGAYGMVRLWTALRSAAGPAPAASPAAVPPSAAAASPAAVPSARGRALAAALVAVTVLAWAHVVVAAARIYPFEYMYFSPVVGGYDGARGDYETDYWAVCQNPALRWLVAHHRDYPTATPPSVGGLFDESYRTPPGFVTSPQPDFFVSSPYYEAPPGYLPTHTVEVAGAPLCTVAINPVYGVR